MKRTLITIILVVAVVAVTISFCVYHLFFCINCIPTGKPIASYTSPEETYTITIYESDRTIRGELTINATGKSRNIYVGCKESYPEVCWESEDVVIINTRRLNLPNDVYDWRRAD